MEKHYKILVDLTLWHLKLYKYKFRVQSKDYVEYGFLCFKFIVG